MIALLCMTNGRRETIVRTLASAEAALRGPVSELWIHDDSGDPAYAAWIRQTWPHVRLIESDGKTGFDGAIRSAWAHLRESSSAEFVFHLEDDFVFLAPVPLDRMIEVLRARPHLVQLALRRQPWNEREVMAGGVIEQHPEEYVEHEWAEDRWLEHRMFFTTNPSLYRRDLIELYDWPSGNESEGRFSHELRIADEDHRFGYWGPRAEGHRVEHIGVERVGSGY